VSAEEVARRRVLALTEDEVDRLGEAEVLDLDELVRLRQVVAERVGALPAGQFAGWLATSIVELRAVLGEDLSGMERELVDQVVGLARAAADGAAAQTNAADLERQWIAFAFAGCDLDDPDVEPRELDTDSGLYNACLATLRALVDITNRDQCVRYVAAAAENYTHWDIAGVNVRLLLKQIARANTAYRPDV
jgi:hypothetical protein